MSKGKGRLAREIIATARARFAADIDRTREELRWQNVKKSLQAEFDQAVSDIEHLPENFQESWKEAKREVGNVNLNPAHMAGLAKRNFVSGIKETVEGVEQSVRRLDTAARISAPRPGTTRENALEMLLGVWGPALPANLADISELAGKLDAGGGKFEFIRQTGHGSQITAALYELRGFLKRQQADLQQEYQGLIGYLGDTTWNDLPETSESPLPSASRANVLRDCDRFFANAMDAQEAFLSDLAAVGAQCRDAISFEAVKAVVLQDGSDAQELTASVLEYADMGLDAVEGLAGKLKHVPDYHSKAAALAVSICVSCLGVLKAFADKQIISMVVARDVSEFQRTHGPGAIYARLNEDKLAVAEMLAQKIVKSVELGLKCAEPLVVAVDKLIAIPVVSVKDIWDLASSVAVTSVEGYQRARIGQAREILAAQAGQLSQDDEQDKPIWESVKEALTGPADEIAGHIGDVLTAEIGKQVRGKSDAIEEFARTRARELGQSVRKAGKKSLAKMSFTPILLDLIGTQVVTPVVQMVVTKLPVTPAQPVSGDDVQALVASCGTRLRARGLAFEAIAGPGGYRPTQDADGNEVACLLSGLQEFDGEQFYEVQMADGRRGQLWLFDLGFRERNYTGADPDPYAGWPAFDARGRPIDEFRDSGARSLGRYEVRIGELWGYLGAEGSFTPRLVDDSALSDWRGRRIESGKGGKGQERAGYRSEDGELIQGRWYRPFANSPAAPTSSDTFLFVPDSGGQHEWARGATPAGNGFEQTVMQILSGVTDPGLRELRKIA